MRHEAVELRTERFDQVRHEAERVLRELRVADAEIDAARLRIDQIIDEYACRTRLRATGLVRKNLGVLDSARLHIYPHASLRTGIICSTSLPHSSIEGLRARGRRRFETHRHARLQIWPELRRSHCDAYLAKGF
eukprot:scaffold7381_cov310-Pinguiococcus_pyrenoidosus.AAC.26